MPRRAVLCCAGLWLCAVRRLLQTVLFVGAVHYAPGEFVGVELDTPEGKNTGSVRGVAYFSCKPNHGLFLRAEELFLR